MKGRVLMMDTGGTIFDRQALNKLLKLTGKTIDIVMVKDFSGFGKNLFEVGNYIKQGFPFLGVQFIAVNEDYDSRLKGYFPENTNSANFIIQKKGEYLCGLPLYGYMSSKTPKQHPL